MGSNWYYRLRKAFAEKEGVEPVEYGFVSTVPEAVQTLWSYSVRGQTVSAYSTGREACLVVFDNVETEHAYWATGGEDFFLARALRQSTADPIRDLAGNRYDHS